MDLPLCLRCHTDGHGSGINAPILGGFVCLDCITDADNRAIWPERYARSDAYERNMAELRKPHADKRCGELETATHSVCPIHGDGSEEE